MPQPDFKGFADAVINVGEDGQDMDSADIQDLAVVHRLLAKVVATKRCGENWSCPCAEITGFPITCYRKTY